jgi:hypothetical protein
VRSDCYRQPPAGFPSQDDRSEAFSRESAQIRLMKLANRMIVPRHRPRKKRNVANPSRRDASCFLSFFSFLRVDLLPSVAFPIAQ